MVQCAAVRQRKHQHPGSGYVAVPRSSTIEITENEILAKRKQAILAHLNQFPFRPAWWLRNCHAQTIWGPVFRRPPAMDYHKEVWDTPDGDELSMYFYPGDAEKPWVLLLHGLEGHINSFYLPGFNQAFHTLGWNVVTLIFRSCDGGINKAKRVYHMGETSDLDFAVRQLREERGVDKLYIAGMSLGANVLCKWLGELGDNVPDYVAGAAALSPPFRPEISVGLFEKAFFGIYNRRFLGTLIPKALEKERQFPGCIDVEKVRYCKSFHVYDTEVTARLHGYCDAVDYWEQVGCHQFLADIRVPTLLTTSADDAFNPADTIPHEITDTSDYLYPLWTTHGGHAGFVYGVWPWKAKYWQEEQLVRFFKALDAPTGPS